MISYTSIEFLLRMRNLVIFRIVRNVTLFVSVFFFLNFYKKVNKNNLVVLFHLLFKEIIHEIDVKKKYVMRK